MQFYIIRTINYIMNVIFICCPSEVMNIWCFKMPRNFLAFSFYFNTFFLVAITNFVCVLQITCATKNIIFINFYSYIKITPNTMKFSSNIGICMPTFKIIFCHFRIPLCHRKSNTFFIISATSSNLNRNLRIKYHIKSCA